MMYQSPAAFKKHSSYSRRAWEHLNAEFETAPALPALTQLVTLGSHPHPGENAVEFRSANLSRCLCRTLKQNAPLVIQLRSFFSTRDSLSYFLPSSDRPVPTTFKLCHCSSAPVMFSVFLQHYFLFCIPKGRTWEKVQRLRGKTYKEGGWWLL